MLIRVLILLCLTFSAVQALPPLDIKIGQALFEKIWVPAPSSTRASDGLGPLYNARSCIQCHVKSSRGNLPETGERAVSTTVRIHSPLGHAYGRQIQNFGAAGITGEAEVQFDFETVTLGNAQGEQFELRKPLLRLKTKNYGPIPDSAGLEARTAPELRNVNTISRISRQAIERLAETQSAADSGVSGRVSRPEHSNDKLGRFGYKAQFSAIETQIQHAFFQDLGLSTPVYPTGSGDCTAAQSACINAPNGNQPESENVEVASTVVNAIKTYLLSLRPASVRSNQQYPAGEALFREIGCISCHSDQLKLDADTSPLYSDLLLHDLGEGLASPLDEAHASRLEWRTASLRGLGAVKKLNPKAGYLHDGRARTILEAILWHGGEAQTHQHTVLNLSPEQRDQLIKYIETL